MNSAQALVLLYLHQKEARLSGDRTSRAMAIQRSSAAGG